MAKSKTKSKSKLDIKQFLLRRGEYVAMGVAGFFLSCSCSWGSPGGRAPGPRKRSPRISWTSRRRSSARSASTRRPTRTRGWPRCPSGWSPLQIHARRGKGFPAHRSPVRPDREPGHQEGKPQRPADRVLPGRSDPRLDEGLRCRGGEGWREDHRSHLRQANRLAGYGQAEEADPALQGQEGPATAETGAGWIRSSGGWDWSHGRPNGRRLPAAIRRQGRDGERRHGGRRHG